MGHQKGHPKGHDKPLDRVPCPTCRPCEACDGSGYDFSVDRRGADTPEDCEACNGTGRMFPASRGRWTVEDDTSPEQVARRAFSAKARFVCETCDSTGEATTEGAAGAMLTDDEPELLVWGEKTLQGQDPGHPDPGRIAEAFKRKLAEVVHKARAGKPPPDEPA